MFFKKNYSRSSSAIINSSVGLFCLLVPILLQFISRRFFLEYLNIDYLGIQGTYTSILSTLSLTELGLQTAIVYCLYKPLKTDNYRLINDIMNVMRVIYQWIGFAFIVFPLFVIPFLPNLLQGIVITNEIKLCFITESCGSAFTYFLAYKRSLLFADQKEYISKLVDLLFNIIFTIIQLCCLVKLQSFLLYSIINCLRVIVSNVFIQCICKKIYPYLRKQKFSLEVFHEIWKYLKNIIFLRFAAYIYTSTDNIVISSIIGTAYVGLLGNYTIITLKITTLANGILAPLSPIIGNLLLDKDVNKSESVFKILALVITLISAVLVVSLYVLLDDLISWWLGREYILSFPIKCLLLADVFINLTYSICCDFIGAAGLFAKDRNIGIIGAIINLVLSVYLAFQMGVLGVLIGTITSQLYFWIARSHLAFKNALNVHISHYYKYCIKTFRDILVIIMLATFLSYLYSLIEINHIFVKMFIGSVITISITLSSFILIYLNSYELRYIFNNIKNRICS